MKPQVAACLVLGSPLLSAAPPAPAVFEEFNATLKASMPLEEGWNNPPRIAQTRVWWWWLNGNTDPPTITRDLEAMKAAGLGGANVIDAGGDNQDGNRRVPHGPDFGSPEWLALFRHAIAEADRLGLEMGFNIQSGWNLGGPRVTPEEAAKCITFSKTAVQGGRPVDGVLPQPETKGGYYRDARVVAVPLPGPSGVRIEKVTASSSQPGMDASRAADGDQATFWVSAGKAAGEGPTASRPEWIELRLTEAARADRVEIRPRPGYGPREGFIEGISGNQRRKLADFSGGGDAPIIATFHATRIDALRVTLTAANDPKEAAARNVQIAEIIPRDGARPLTMDTRRTGVHQLNQKAYFQYPGAFTATEAWHLLDPGPAQPWDHPVPATEVLDLTKNLDASGRLHWDAPPGTWEILRFGATLSGAHVSTHSENAGGLAIDYLDRAALDAYWRTTLDPIFAAVKPHLGRSLRFLHTDSWELGPVNWTRLMPAEFQRLRGYDLTPWLPVLAGHIIGSRDESDRFLNDLRRTLADLMAENKYQGFADQAHAMGLGIHPESGGPHAGPMDALRNLGVSDIPMGEFWSTSPRHRTRDDQRFFVKQTTSAAHVYGRRVSLAEAFTNIGRHWQHDPRSLKPTFDRAACEGHNLTMWHTFPSSKAEHGLPGAAYFAGEHFNPNLTWWEQGKAFIAYMNRCHFMLQQGVGAADVLHFYGENIPSFVRLKRDDPAKCLPGYDYDVIDAHALLHRVTADGGGHAVLPEGTRYRIVSLTPHHAVGLPVLRHLAALVENGVTLVGPRPQRPFSLAGGKAAEKEFGDLTAKLWDATPQGVKRVGKGRVIWGRTTREVLQADGVPADFSWSGGDADTHIDFIQRRTDDTRVVFVANCNGRAEDVTLRFRGTGWIPEIWDPVTGARREATSFRFREGVTELPYPMQPEEAFFVIFRRPATGARDDAPNVPEFAKLTDITGPWEVSFDPQWGGPESVTFDSLVDWTAHADEGIRHYSGAATYRKRFEAPAGSRAVFLDLGMVESLCEVKLNGADLGVWWSFPFRREITRHLRPGANNLEVKVVNLWCNRIIGDAALPADKRRTRTNITRLAADTPLEPSGLLGPVRLLAVVPPFATACGADPEVASDTRFLENGKVKIGVDMTSGGAIFWFSELPDGPNLLNHADRGRFIQQSYYGKEDGSSWAGKPWRWNPVQGGHYQGKPARLLEAKVTDTSLYTRSIPINWAGGELLDDCRMEQWIELREQVASVRFRFAYDGREHHPPCHQELPAVFIDFDLSNLVYFQGDQPWTGGALQRDVPGWPNEQRQVDEEWAAFTGPDGRGVGVFFPGTKLITCYRHPGPPGPAGGGCSYFAPIQSMAIKPGFRHDYRIHLTIGTPEEMRDRFKPLRPAR